MLSGQTTLNMSYDEIVEWLDNYFYMERGTDIRGLPNYVGQTSNGVATLQVIGNKADISQAALTMSLPENSKKAFLANTIFLQQFLENAFGKNAEGAFDTVIQLWEQSRGDSDTERTAVFDDKQISVIYHDSLELLTVTVKAN
jgi:hypothetical protein